MGKVTLIIGPMWSGKTTELFRRIRRARHAGQVTKLYKYVNDKRYTSQSLAVSHDGVQEHAYEIKDAREIEACMDISGATVIGIEEAQFIDNLVEVVERLANSGKHVIVAALNSDYKREGFANIMQLIPKCEEVIQLFAVCHQCKKDASFTRRLVDSNELELIGGADAYEAVCRECHLSSDPVSPTKYKSGDGKKHQTEKTTHVKCSFDIGESLDAIVGDVASVANVERQDDYSLSSGPIDTVLVFDFFDGNTIVNPRNKCFAMTNHYASWVEKDAVEGQMGESQFQLYLSALYASQFKQEELEYSSSDDDDVDTLKEASNNSQGSKLPPQPTHSSDKMWKRLAMENVDPLPAGDKSLVWQLNVHNGLELTRSESELYRVIARKCTSVLRIIASSAWGQEKDLPVLQFVHPKHPLALSKLEPHVVKIIMDCIYLSTMAGVKLVDNCITVQEECFILFCCQRQDGVLGNRYIRLLDYMLHYIYQIHSDFDDADYSDFVFKYLMGE